MSVSAPVALVGAGSMGTHHARVLAKSSRAHLALVVDADEARADELASVHGGRGTTDVDEATGCAAAVIASPTESHVDVAMHLLAAGIPLLVEKPLAADLASVDRLLDAAAKAGVPLTCGFVERFSPAVTTATELLADEVIHLTAMRHSPRAPRINTGVIHDLLIHDLDLALRFTGSSAIQVGAAGWQPGETSQLEIVDATLGFESGAIAALSADRWNQRKIRSVSVSTRSTLVELDLVRQDVTLYRHVDHEQIGGGYRAETVVDIPFIRHAGEPLALQLDHFLDLVAGSEDHDAERATLRAPHELAFRVQDVVVHR